MVAGGFAAPLANPGIAWLSAQQLLGPCVFLAAMGGSFRERQRWPHRGGMDD